MVDGVFMLRVALVLVLVWAGALSPALAREPDKAGEFDLYVLSLSWSPTYCRLKARGADEQCAGGSHRFVVHGLWPQYERGWPQYCRSALASPRFDRLSERLIRDMMDIMPSKGLIRHQWQKHGMCSGLTPPEYFSTLRRANALIQKPEILLKTQQDQQIRADQVQAAFVKANPQLTRDMIFVSCTRAHLEEVRICFTRTLQPRRCPILGRDTCGGRSVLVPAQ